MPRFFAVMLVSLATLAWPMAMPAAALADAHVGALQKQVNVRILALSDDTVIALTGIEATTLQEGASYTFAPRAKTWLQTSRTVAVWEGAADTDAETMTLVPAGRAYLLSGAAVSGAAVSNAQGDNAQARANITGGCTVETAAEMCVTGQCNPSTLVCLAPNGQFCTGDTDCASNICAADRMCGTQNFDVCTSDAACRSESCLDGVCQVPEAYLQGQGLFESCQATPGQGRASRGAWVLFVLVMCVAMRRRRRRGTATLLCLLAGFVAPGAARAQESGFAIERAVLAPANSRFFSGDTLLSGPALADPNVRGGAKSLALRLDAGWAHQSLVLRTSQATLSNPIEDQVALTLHASWNPIRPLRVALDFPLQIYARGGLAAGGGFVVQPPPDTAAAGDLAAAVTYVFETPLHNALRVGATVRFRFPTGSQADFMGDGTTSGSILVTMAGDVGYLAYALTLGGRLRTEAPFAGDTIGSEVRAVPAVGLQTRDHRWLLGLEVPMALGVVAAHPFSNRGYSADPILGVHFWPLPSFGVRAGVGTSLTAAVGEARWRVLAGVQWLPFLPQAAPAPATAPMAPVAFAPALVPVPVAVLPDADGDSVPDAQDLCPHGEPGDPNLLGCFASDPDGDGVFDPNDRCPAEPGTLEDGGCPPPTKVVVQEDRIAVTEKIEFEVNLDTLKPESLATLDDIVKVMQTHPQIHMLQVQGHTDTSGQAKKNLKLSQMRADAVMKYLVDHGVAAARLQAQGFGSQKPQGPNDTPEQRSLNRRVDFIIIEAEQAPRDISPMLPKQ